MATLDRWLAEQITTATGLEPGARNARARRCTKCQALVLVGMDEDVCAEEARADPQPLSPAGEALAWLGGRVTYALGRSGRRLRLSRRDRWQIAGQPAGRLRTIRADIVAAHRCGAGALPGLPSVLVTAPDLRRTAPDVCPF